MFIKAGQVAIVEMEVVSGVVCMETYNNYPSLGRLTIRDEQKTIAMGKVTKLVKLGDMTADAAANNNQSLAENE
jgi:peptide chain release factor subunit 3